MLLPIVVFILFEINLIAGMCVFIIWPVLSADQMTKWTILSLLNHEQIGNQGGG